MKSFRRAPLLLICQLVPVLAAAQQITRVGIIDIQKVYTIYYKESKEVMKIEEFKTKYQKDIAAVNSEILNLENAKLDAEKEGSKDLVLKIDQMIFDKKQYLNNFKTVRNKQYQQLLQNLADSQAFLDEIAAAIQFVAESEGFSLVMKLSNDQLLWWAKEIDITEKVIRELFNRAKKPYPGGG